MRHLHKRASLLAIGTVMLTVMFSNSLSEGAAFSDTFTGSPDPAWTTYIHEPDSFTSVNFLGDDRLEIGTGPNNRAANRTAGQQGTLYNTQGRYRNAGITGNWSASADLYVPIATNSFPADESNIRRTDMWLDLGTSPAGTESTYAVIGYTDTDPTDNFNPDQSGRIARLRIYDPESATAVNDWIDLSGTYAVGFHNLKVERDGNNLEYYVDNSLVYTDTTLPPAGANGINYLQRLALTAYNFNDTVTAGNSTDTGSKYYWDNVAVPEPTSLAAIGLGALGLLRRRRK